MKDNNELGDCCACQGTTNVRNVVMHDKRAPVPGTGWGCVVCHLPNDGAISVICDDCLENETEIREACWGYPNEKKRVSLNSLAEPFAHDMAKH